MRRSSCRRSSIGSEPSISESDEDTESQPESGDASPARGSPEWERRERRRSSVARDAPVSFR